MKNILNKLTLQDKYKIKLKDETLLIITQILDNNPEFFDLIEDIFNQIINDDNIVINIFNFSYLSNHILKILDSFNKLKYINSLFNIEIFCNLLNFIFSVLLEENKETIKNSDYLLENFIKITENIINFINIIKTI